jgi:hypothetical protein
MARQDINYLLNEFGKVYKEAVLFYAGYYVNRKTGKDTLSESEIVEGMKIEVNDNNELSISLFNYFLYIETGRKKGAKGVPPEAILDWVKRKRLHGIDKTTKKVISDDAFVWLIINAIKRDGISPRPIFSKAFELAYKEFDNSLNDVLNKMIDEMVINFIESATTTKINAQIANRKK